MREKVIKIKNRIIAKINDISKKKMVVICIAIFFIALLMMLSPTLIKNILGSVNNIKQGSAAGVEIETPKRVLLGDPNGWEQYLGATIYNWDNFQVTIKNDSEFKMTNISVSMTGTGEVIGTDNSTGNFWCVEGFSNEIESKTSNTFKCNGVIKDAYNYNDVTETMTISYSMNGNIYNDTVDIDFYHIVPKINNETVLQNTTDPAIYSYKYKGGEGEDFYQKISKTDIYMDITESLDDQNINFSYRSKFGNHIYIEAPQSDDSAKTIYNQSLAPRLSEYFSYSTSYNEYKLTEKHPSDDDIFIQVDNHKLWGTPSKVTNGTVTVYVPVFAKYCKNDNCNILGYNYNTYQEANFEIGTAGYPYINLTIYDKKELANNINKAQSKLDMYDDSIYNNSDLKNAIKTALSIYKTRVLSQNDINNAVDALLSYSSDEYVPPKFPADYSELDNMIAQARSLNNVTSVGEHQLYTTESWNNFQNILNEVSSISRNYMIDEQSIVEDAINELKTVMSISDEGLVYANGYYDSVSIALSSLKDLGIVYDITDLSGRKLEKVKITINDKKYDLYTTESWDVLQSSVDRIDTTLKANEQEKIENIANNITKAIEGLEYAPAIYDELLEIISTYENNKDSYTEVSKIPVDNFIATYDKNIKINNQILVDNLVNELKELIARLQYNPANYEILDAKIIEYQSTVEYKNNWYTEETKDAVEKYILSIDRNKTFDKQSEVDNYVIELENLIRKLRLKQASYTDFDEKAKEYKQSEAYTNNWYTEESRIIVDEYISSIDRTKLIDKQGEVDNYVIELESKINALILKPADYTKVNELVKKVDNDITPIKDMYLNYDNVINIINKIVYNYDISEQSKVESIIKELEEAILKLKFKPANYDELKELIAKLPNDYSAYNKDLQDEFKQLLNDLEKLSNDLFIFEQEKVNKMTERVKLLLKKISESEASSEVTKDVVTDTPVEIKEDKSQSEKLKHESNNIIKVTPKESTKTDTKVIRYIKINGQIIDLTKKELKLTVKSNVSSVSIDVSLYNNKYKYEVYGGQKLTYGDNEITVIVTDNLNEHYVYTITVSRQSANNYLTTLEVKGSNIVFDKRKLDYNIKVDRKTKKLNITVLAEDKDAKIAIKGNNNLKDGSKVIIEVKSVDSNVRIYTLNIQKPKSIIVEISIILVVGLSALAGIFRTITIRKQN